ncbi:conserved Plasmodium protein, unknown function [Plasmodium berghei]|uniref:Uncharacterized protein n=2 Tax=Plasmodium berghei TaxID=5821 RepID=A0A509AHA5_PLABA|nr:conserved Plasmodium protein, unknown function [Plasmodium berghei ANKA]CXH96260.1 conserved Plasmodium protein, unknown function [Plasmodium berghei]SCL91122.1 conserved Plasmodium protein, unknown function [Plasmodium berghei]SCM15429.1 conserved Plasmodium protein, unknown function [Plasmodium berghei]SCM17225.1 conserved Plasmodium protein, unknown function [Plasmodium berghei]SCN22313.1 conserved Plasmodium protein, unknown function [Plasmodium berghei]|eukprot:XP_034420015.1 conserved Plasmodium protein, unknown function [Plasmodium berghei ANKA]
MDKIEPYKLSIKKENAHIASNENDNQNKKKNLCSGKSLDKYDILLTPEYVQGYFGEKNNILKFSFKKIIYPFKNLIIIYDLLNQSQSIFSKHSNKVMLVRCKECYKTALSIEDLKDSVNIYIWNKTNLKILINIKIKKKNFLDIEYLNNSNILLLCKWYDKLILFVFSLILCKKKKKVKLRKKGVYIMKSINDFYIKKSEYMKNKPTKNTFKKLKDKAKQKNLFTEIKTNCGSTKLMKRQYKKKSNENSLSRIKHILVTIKKRKKKYMACLNNYTNINRTSSLYEQNTLKERNNKIYIRKIKKADKNFYFIKNYEREGICFFYIYFVNISEKWKKKNNILLKNFKLFVDIKNTICIFNKKEIFMYVLKNCIIYEKLKYKNYKCNFFSNSTKFFLMNQGYHFCSILYMTLFINDLFLSYNFGETNKPNKTIEEEIDTKQNSPDNCVEYFSNENNLLEKNNFVSNSLQNNIIHKYLMPKLDNFLNTEICVIEIITLFVIEKEDDISKIIRLQENIENNCTWRKNNNKNVERTYEHFMQKNKNKINSCLKKYLIIGTEDGIIIVIDYLKPHKIMHLEKICNENIASIFVFQNDILILTGLGFLYFINAHNFSTYKYVDIFEILIGKYISRIKYGEASQSFCSNSSIKHDILNYFIEYEEEKIQKAAPQNIIRNSFTNRKIDIKKVKNKCMNIKGNNFILSEKKENFFLKSNQPNHENIKKNYDVSEKKKLSNYYSNFNRSSRYICSGVLLDIYTLVIGTSLDEIITYNLLTTEMYFIYKKSKNINYFLCENNNIIYNIGNTLYKSSLNNYDNSSTFLTIPNICITAFLFYSDILLICGTLKGNLYFFSISDDNVKVVNKVDKKKFLEEKKKLLLKSKNSQKKNYDNGWIKEKNNDIIFSINKCINKSLRKRNVNNYINHTSKKTIGYNNKFDSIVKENNMENDKIIGLLFNRSKTNLLCSFRHGIFLLRIVIRGNEKVDIKCVRYFNVSNIMNINLVKDFDNLFFITTRENFDIGSNNMINNKININQREEYKKHVVEYFYSHHLCSFISVKIKRSKMDKIYFNILFENTWFYEFSYYNDEHFILLENNNKTFDNDKNKCITFLNPSTIIIYSYSINRINKKHEAGNKINKVIDKILSQNEKSNCFNLKKKEKRNSDVISDSREKLSMCVSINRDKIYSTEEKNIFSKYGNMQTSSFSTKNIFGNNDNFFYDSNNYPISYNNEGSKFHQNDKVKNIDLKNSLKLKKENINFIANRTSYNEHDEKKKKNYTKYKTLRNIIQKRKNIELCNYKNIIYGKNYNDKQILNSIQRNIYYKENKTKENLFFSLDKNGEQKQSKELPYKFNQNKKKENFITCNNEGNIFAKEIGYSNVDTVNKSKLYITRYLKKYLQIDIVEENKKKEEKYFSKCVQEKCDKLNEPLINNGKNDGKFISFLNNSNNVTDFSSVYKYNDISTCKGMNTKNMFFQHKIRNMHLENKSTKIIPVENEQTNSSILIGTKKMEINKHEAYNGGKEGFPVIRKRIEKYGRKNNYRNMCTNTKVPWKNSLYFNNFYNCKCANNIIDNNFNDIFYDPNLIDSTKDYTKKINSIKCDNDVPHSYNFQNDAYSKNQLFN